MIWKTFLQHSKARKQFVLDKLYHAPLYNRKKLSTLFISGEQILAMTKTFPSPLPQTSMGTDSL